MRKGRREAKDKKLQWQIEKVSFVSSLEMLIHIWPLAKMQIC